MKVERVCKNCNNNFIANSKDTKRGRAVFCSLKCSNSYNIRLRKIIHENNVTCSYCNKSFYKSEYKQKLSKSGLFFCCRDCKDKAQRIGGIKEIQPSHYTDSLTDYREAVKRDRGIYQCEKCNYNEHIEILQIHHKDRDRKNNNIDNLIILCPNCHNWDHHINNDGIYSKIRANNSID